MKTKTPDSRDRYLKLVQQFPLVTIKSKQQYESALEFLKKLAIRDESSLDEGQKAYLAALTQFVGDYEDAHLRDEIDFIKPASAARSKTTSQPRLRRRGAPSDPCRSGRRR